MSQFDKRIKVNTIIENQLPEFIVSDFPNATEFFKQYYISQEFQGGPSDLINNFDQYLKVDNLVPEVIVGVTTSVGITTIGAKTIDVTSTKGFPDEYGLLKIDDEIITYTGKTTTSFTGCERGFSGITGYNVGITSSLLEVNQESLKFEDTSASSHVSGSNVTNLSVLFVQEFYKKLKKTFLPGLENNDFAKTLDVGNFIKFARSFYQSKGVEESIRVLFKVLYGVEAKILDLENNLIKPSSSEFIRREVVIADVITPTGLPQNLVGQTIFKSDDLNTSASVSEVEIFTRNSKSYYKMSLFVGFSDRDLIQGQFTIPGKTKALEVSPAGSSIITVDSTIGFAATGTLISGSNTIKYTSKSVNQFFGCTGILKEINKTDDIRADESIFGYENGDLSKRVDLRITGVLSELVEVSDIKLVAENEKIFSKNVGEKILNSDDFNLLNYKEKFANSWRYNTSSRFEVEGQGPFVVKMRLDKSSIKKGDLFEVIRRNEQLVDSTFNVKNVENPNAPGITTSVVTDEGLSATGIHTSDKFLPNQDYDIRRVIEKVSSSGVEIDEGNNQYIANVLNVYTDSDIDGYAASNSLPDYDIKTNIVKETFTGTGSNELEGATGSQFSFINFNPKNPDGTNRDIKFIQGDAVIYQPDGDPIVGLDTGRIYFVDPEILPNQNIQKIALYNSRSQIGTASTIQLSVGGSATTNHNFVLQKHANKTLSANKILRKFPLSQNLFVTSKQERPIINSGMLIDGVQIHAPYSEDIIYYGPIDQIDLENAGSDYDVVNPPVLKVEAPTISTGTTALIEPIIEGSVKKIFVDPQDFDISAITNISLTGGNGSGCLLEPVLGARFRELFFDSRNLFFGGSLDLVNETITFNEPHNLANGQKIFYRNEGNPSLGIGSAYDNNDIITGTLSDGDPYFVRVVNSSTIRIFNTKNDSLSGIAGINTIGIATDTPSGGTHKFRTESVNTLLDVKVINSGSGYQHRKLRVNPAGISTSFNTINFSNHGFAHGDIVEYSPTIGLGTTIPKNIEGLSTSISYYVMKVNDDTFKLASSKENFDRGNFVVLSSTGTGYQTFTYPEIKVNVQVSYATSVTGTINITPLVTGKITGSYLYEGGTDYGSTILNHQINPKIDILNGKNAELRPVIVNGKILEVIVANQGSDYNSLPDVVVVTTGQGTGAIVRPVINNGRITDAIVINSGIGYDNLNTRIDVISSGKNGKLQPRVRGLNINNKERFGDFNLQEKESNLAFSLYGYPQSVAESFEPDRFDVKPNGQFDKVKTHSPIIGWAYDGNPIYGPFGFEDPNDTSSSTVIIKSSYAKDKTKVFNRPTGFAEGFFVNDYTFDDSGDLDIHNGRFCKTPEFPNGIYAYFATVEIGSSSNKLESIYPFFIGNTYRSPFIEDNVSLNHDFDFNNSNLIRNTYPYNVSEKFADNDFIIESNEEVKQLTNVESVHKGFINDIEILDGGTGYKVGDLTNFDDTDTEGSGFSAEVSDIVGIGVSKIETTLTSFNNAVFVWNSDTQVQVNYLPFLELNNQDAIVVSGLSTTIVNLTGSFNVGLQTASVGLAKSMKIGNVSGTIEDIFVNNIPNTVAIGGSLRIGEGNSLETLKVLNIFDKNKAIRVLRVPGISGAAHTFGSSVDVLSNSFTIPVRTEKFESSKNDIVFFNPKQSVGLGTTGIGQRVDTFIGDLKTEVGLVPRTIRIPNHPFKTGQKVGFSTSLISSGNSKLNVSPTIFPSDSFTLPFTGETTTDVFIIKKDENHIGIVTTVAGVGNTTEGLFFLNNGGATGIGTGLYTLTSKNDQVTGDIDRIVTTVTTKVAAAGTTTHNLKNGDRVDMTVIPNISVGIGTTTPIDVRYNSNFDKLIINPVDFTQSNVQQNKINIQTHGFNTGDKVFYDGNATGLGTGSYFVYKVNDNIFQLGKTFKDVTIDPVNLLSITAGSGANQSIAPINPQIKVVKNQKLTFGLSNNSLVGFDFKIFYDQGLTNEYSSSGDSTEFNVVKVGTTGSADSKLNVEFTKSSPTKLYYGLTKGGFISTSDIDVNNYNEILFIDSAYNGKFKISNVTNETFDFSPLEPEFLTYNDTDCDKLEYSTSSKNVEGSIKDFKVISSGFNYKKIPKFKSIISKSGVDANIKVTSNDIGKIKKSRILDIGYEYSSDKTLSPEAFIPPIVNIDNLDVVTSVDIVSGGLDYTSAPDLLVFNPVKNIVVDNTSLQAIAPTQTISDVEVIAPINGLDSVQHRIVAINNSNGVGIEKLETSNSGIVTCELETPTNGFPVEPFAINDEIFVEGIVSIGGTFTGDGFNSENYNYQFFKVKDYQKGTPSILKFSLAGLTTNPGIAKTFQSGFPQLINKKNYPIIRPIQSRGQFDLNEKLNVNNVQSDLSVVEIRDDYIKVDGLTVIRPTDRISGNISGTSAEIILINKNKAKFKVDFSSRQEYGWLDDTGKLSEDFQVIPNNDYYQNLSYSVKSPIVWDEFVNPVNRIVHPAGLKNFADTQIQNNINVGVGKSINAISNLIIDLINEPRRVDATNNFDFVRDEDVVGNKSKKLLFSTKTLTDFTRCISNRVLVHDDISDKFSSVGFANNDTIIDELNADLGNYYIQIIDPDTNDAQFTELVVLTDEDDVILFEKTTDFTNIRLGSFKTEITSGNVKNLLFEPVNKFTKDHDLKILKVTPDILENSSGSTLIGNTKLSSVNKIAPSGVGNVITTIAEFPKTDFNACYANIFVQDSVFKDVNYNEIILDFDGTNTSLSQIYVDKNLSNSNSVVGIITSKFENDLIKLQIINDRTSDLETRSNIVGLGTTTVGISTFRFNALGQPAGAERSARLQSNYETGTSSVITYASIFKDFDTSVKSLVRVSTGQTSAIHQIITIRDDSDVLTVQYPFVSIGSTSGIGTFGGEINGNNIDLKFYPDANISSLIEVQSFNQIFYTESDFDNTPNDLKYGSITQRLFLDTFDGLEGKRANKTKFDLKYKNIPIYQKSFNPSSVTSTGLGVSETFNIPNHFFNNNEELSYKPDSTFIGVAGTAISIGSTENIAGVVTTLLPSTVYAKVTDENNISLFSRPEYVASGQPIHVTGFGSGNAHKLTMRKQLTKTIIGLDGVVQQPITFTKIAHTLDANIGAATSQFVLSGISSINPTDVLKINDEFMAIENVGFASLPQGPINDAKDVALGISVLPVVKVKRGVLGVGATTHSQNDEARIHRGSFNIIDSTVHFIDPPKGNQRSRRTDTNLPFVKATFSGRTFLRQNYTTNMLFDDVSDDFTGIGKTYTLTVGGANTSAGVSVGNGVLFINGIFQEPSTTNNPNGNYKILNNPSAGISTVQFSGITSTNGQSIISEFDINQNQVPRGGIIVSLASTPGLGYAPLVGAKASLFKDADGGITNVIGIGTTSGISLGIQTASYDNTSGIITVTTEKVHGFAPNRPSTVHLKDLEFKCPKTVVGQPTNATYDGATGISTITIANHGLVNGDAVILETGSICFRCSKDSFATVHCYPRASDPAANQYLTVTNVTTNTFRVDVGASQPGDIYDHQFESATATAVKTIGGGGYVGVTTTIFQDHERPLFVVGIVSERTFEVQAGTSTIPHTYQGGGNAIEFFSDNTFGSGYRGATVSIGVTDIAYEHRFVSAGIGSIKLGNFNGSSYTATDANYISHTGNLILTIPNHNLTTSNKIGIDTGGIVFKCSKDNFFGNHPYPRSVSITSSPNGDPIAGIVTDITSTTTNTVTIFVGQGGGGGTGANITATVGIGGTLAFNIVSAGTSYVNPELIIPEPTYENLEVEGISRIGVGPTTDTGVNLLVDVEVGASSTTVGIGSTLFEISKFKITRPGHSFRRGDKFRPVGLITAAHLTRQGLPPIQEFEFEVIDTFRDTFSSFQFGEIDYIDDIKNLQNGERTRFPLFFNGQPLSFEKDDTNSQSQLIDLDAVLLIFVNGVLQQPGVSYEFRGGSTVTFKEAPTGETGPDLNDHDHIDIFFYKGEENVDVEIKDIQEEIKRGDQFRVLRNDAIDVSISNSTQEKNRITKQILGAKVIETDVYSGLGIDENQEKPVRFEKQKTDIVINGEIIPKTRSSIEPQIYPTAKIIGDLTTTNGPGTLVGDGIFVDDATSFLYEKDRYNQSGDIRVDALITHGETTNIRAAATATVSATGTITGINITEPGSGYSGSATIKLSRPFSVGFTTVFVPDGSNSITGIGSTAIATISVVNGSIDPNSVSIVNPGFGYSQSNPPQVIIDPPAYKTEKITGIENVQGYTGIITGIEQVKRNGSLDSALKIFYRAVTKNKENKLVHAAAASDLKQGYPILVKDTSVGDGTRSVFGTNAGGTVGIGNTFLDNVYIVQFPPTTDGSIGIITVHLHTSSNIAGINTEGFFNQDKIGLTTSIGEFHWGRLYGNNVKRSSNPIAIGVSGLTVDAGLSTFPTIQRKHFGGSSVRGLRSTGAIRVFGL